MKNYSLDKIELLHGYALKQDANEYGMKLDITRIAGVSTLSKEGHKLFVQYRKMLTRSADGEKPTVTQKKAIKAVGSKLFAMGAAAKK